MNGGVRLSSLVLALVLVQASVAGQAPLSSASDFSVIDRRSVDGSVLVIPRITGSYPGADPFRAAQRWELELSSDLFRVKTDLIPARAHNLASYLPAVTFENGEVVGNSLVSALGGHAKGAFAPGEIVRVIDLNAALESVRFDLEAVCNLGRKRRPRGRAVFVLSGQVGKKTLDEANRAVAAQLEPVGLAQVVRQCDPASGEPPCALRTGLERALVEDRLGPPRRIGRQQEEVILDYGAVRLHFRDGVVSEIVVPALDGSSR